MKKLLGLLLSMVLALSCMGVNVKAESYVDPTLYYNGLKLLFKEVGGDNDSTVLQIQKKGSDSDKERQLKTIMVGQSFTIELVDGIVTEDFKVMPGTFEDFNNDDMMVIDNKNSASFNKYVSYKYCNGKEVYPDVYTGKTITFTGIKAGKVLIPIRLLKDYTSQGLIEITVVDPKVAEPSLEFKSTTVNSGDVKSVKVKNMHKLLDSTLKLDVADKSICSASIKGDTIEIKGKKAGSTTVTLTNSYKGTKKSKSIKVTVKETKKVKPSLSKAKVSVKAGKSATVKIKNYSKLSNVSVKTSKKSVATAKVNKKGTVTIKAKGKGTATITVKSAGGSKKIKVTVK